MLGINASITKIENSQSKEFLFPYIKDIVKQITGVPMSTINMLLAVYIVSKGKI